MKLKKMDRNFAFTNSTLGSKMSQLQLRHQLLYSNQPLMYHSGDGDGNYEDVPGVLVKSPEFAKVELAGTEGPRSGAPTEDLDNLAVKTPFFSKAAVKPSIASPQSSSLHCGPKDTNKSYLDSSFGFQIASSRYV